MLHKSIYSVFVAFLMLFAANTNASAVCTDIAPSESGDGYINSSQKVVDLGLSVCWAGWNLGANSPEGYGDHYAWGETSPKSYFSEGTYSYHNGSSYNSIGSNISGTRYDAARAQWGGSWRLPTEVEADELVNRCTWIHTTYRGVDGYKVVGPNGNAIFLPFAGNYYCENENEIATGGDYWTGTYAEEENAYATLLYVTNEGTRTTLSSWREFGRSIRAVCPSSNNNSNSGRNTGTSIGIANQLRDVRSRAQSGDNSSSYNGGGSNYDSRMVDLGLSVCWATCNVGASSPEEYGNYYAWGETSTKSVYSESTYQYHNGNSYIEIGRNIGGTRYDVARAQWGGNWRMPTTEEYLELKERCTWSWTTVNGVSGNRVTGPNGNSIFLPATSWIGGSERMGDAEGSYWTSDRSSEGSDKACAFYTYPSGTFLANYYYREHGVPVRPVCPR